MRRIFFTLIAIGFFGSSGWACDEATGNAVASQVTSDFAALVGFTKATCLPAADGPRCSLVCMSDLNIVGDNRNLALTMITASAGKRMRDAGISKFAMVSFADRELLQARKVLMLSASDASRLQLELSRSSEPPLKKAAQIAAAYKIVDIPRKK
jgi:hypothetical protein